MKRERNYLDPLIKSLKFVSCLVRRNLINFMKCCLLDILNYLGPLINSADDSRHWGYFLPCIKYEWCLERSVYWINSINSLRNHSTIFQCHSIARIYNRSHVHCFLLDLPVFMRRPKQTWHSSTWSPSWSCSPPSNCGTFSDWIPRWTWSLPHCSGPGVTYLASCWLCWSCSWHIPSRWVLRPFFFFLPRPPSRHGWKNYIFV